MNSAVMEAPSSRAMSAVTQGYLQSADRMDLRPRLPGEHGDLAQTPRRRVNRA